MSLQIQNFNEVVEVLKTVKSAIIISHYHPDADAYGSSCGLALSLRAAGKEAVVLNVDGIVPKFQSIPGVKGVTVNLPLSAAEAVVMVCDCGDLSRVGDAYKPLVSGASLSVNIDHHSSNGMFAKINLVVEGASSTSEIIFELLLAAGLPITKEVAIALFTGVMADSGSFRYSNTTAKTFSIAAKLVEFGADASLIGISLYGNSTPASVKLHGEIIANMELLADGKVCILLATLSLFEKFRAAREDTEGLVEKGRDIAGVMVSALIREDNDLLHVSMRSKSSALDVSAIARKYGGGGHKAAAAFRLKTTLPELRAIVSSELEALVHSN